MNELTKTAEGTCQYCQSTFSYERWVFDETVCPACMPKHEEIMAEESRLASIERERIDKERRVAKATEIWEEMIPDRISDTDTNHADFRNSLMARAELWKPTREKPWLGIVGMKGCCKTRIAALRLKKAMQDEDGVCERDYESSSIFLTSIRIQNPAHPLFLTAYDFSKAVVDQYSKDKDESKNAKFLLRNARNAAWLLFDDLGKAKATPAVVSELFALIDHRHSHNIRTIWTANSTPEEFCEGMPPDVAGPLVRRLKESSTLFAIQ